MIKCDKVKYIYHDDTLAIDDVTFSVDDGDSLALLGENGAGKSTLIMLMLGFINLASGSIFINGNEVTSKSVKKIRQDVGIVFQDSDDQLFMPSVYEDIAFGVRNLGLEDNEVIKRIEDAIKLTDIEHLRNKQPHKISTGEKRRVAIAGVIAMQPKVLVMDEPTSGLDFKSTKQLISVLNSIKSTKLIATHDLAFAKSVCNKAIILKDGKLKAFGSSSEILEDSELLAKYSLG